MTRSSPTKLQRWLDLIAYLVGRRIPVPVEELMERIPGYAEKWKTEQEKARATARRTFERDKEELREAGIPIRTVRYSVHYGREEIEGYRIDRRDVYLPYLRLVAKPGKAGAAEYGGPARVAEVEIAQGHLELSIEAAKRAASLPAFPLEREARSALRKLTFDLAEPPPDDASPRLFVESGDAGALRDRLRLLSDALLLRKRVRFRYHGLYRGVTTDRDVAPYGLLFQQGQWYIVGHDSLRDDLRVFRVGRMDDVERNTRLPNTPDYAVPADFRLSDHVGKRPWELGEAGDDTLQARVLFRFPLGIWAERNGYGSLVEQRDDGSAVRAFVVRQVDPFVRWVLACDSEAEIMEPEELRQALRAVAS
ncbi:MAG: helix-turn-helix transcriptional regulator, partial [Longimicrobiales bacterium]